MRSFGPQNTPQGSDLSNKHVKNKFDEFKNSLDNVLRFFSIFLVVLYEASSWIP